MTSGEGTAPRSDATSGHRTGDTDRAAPQRDDRVTDGQPGPGTLAYRMVAGCFLTSQDDGYQGPTAADIVDELGSDQHLGALCFVQLISMAAIALQALGQSQGRDPLDVMAETWPTAAAAV